MSFICSKQFNLSNDMMRRDLSILHKYIMSLTPLVVYKVYKVKEHIVYKVIPYIV